MAMPATAQFENHRLLQQISWALTLALLVCLSQLVMNWLVAEIAPGTGEFFASSRIWLGAGLITFAIVWLLMMRGVLQPPAPRYGVMMVLWAAGSIVLVRIMPQLAMTCWLLAIYSASALWPQSRRHWQENLLLAVLVALVLPFGVATYSGLGFVLRVFSTDVAAQFLQLLGYSFLSAHDVLIFENSVAQVDAPCSGLKSIFTGSSFFLAASMVLRREVSRRWIAIFGAFLFLVLAANIFRIVLLVVVAQGLNQPDFAAQLHVPLGLVLFMGCCIAAMALLAPLPMRSLKSESTAIDVSRHGPVGFVFVPVAMAVLSILAMPFRGPAVQALPIDAPPGMSLTAQDLTVAEKQFYATQPGTAARKWRFQTSDFGGALLVVRSSAVTGMHAPEVCFSANGYVVHDMSTILMGPERPIRTLHVGAHRQQAFYWMQSRATVTDSFLDRFNRYVFAAENDWIMVTILLDPDQERPLAPTLNFLGEIKTHFDHLIQGTESLGK